MNWIPISEDDARLHPLYGFGGMLYLLYAVELLGLAMTFQSVISIARYYGIEQLASPSFGMVWLHLALNLPFLLMAPMKARAMPVVSIICYWVGMLLSLQMFFVRGPALEMTMLARIAAWGAWGVFFTLYLLRSRRVNVTYRLRVRADEPATMAPPAPGVV